MYRHGQGMVCLAILTEIRALQRFQITRLNNKVRSFTFILAL